jgi:hypothetical protein
MLTLSRPKNDFLIPVATGLKRRMILLASTNNFEEEISMRKFYGFVAFLLLVVPALMAQEHYTQGPVWRVQLIRVKPNQMDAYLTSLRQSSKPFIEEEKRQGIIVDYKVFLKETKSNPQDWDIAVAIQYKNHAAMDGEAAKAEAVRDKVLGGKQPAQQLAEKRGEIREIISSDLLQEIVLK